MTTEAVNFKTTWGVGTATLTWEAPSTTNLLNWLVEVKEGSGSWAKIPYLEASKHSYVAESLDPSITYFFRVWAVVKQNAKESSGQPVAPPLTEKLVIKLTADKTGVEVASAPKGTVKVGFAYMKNLGGEGVKYATLSYPLSVPYVPPTGYPVVDAQALNSSNTSIGGWAGRIETTPTQTPPPPPPPPPHEEPTSPTATILGLNAGNWGTNALPDIKGTGVKAVRLSHGLIGEAKQYKAEGFKVCVIFGEEGTIGSINPTTYAKEVAEAAAAYNLDAIEVLNEPSGSWFWSDPTNYTAYVGLCKAAYEAVKKASPSTAVLINWGGGSTLTEFGEKCKALGVLSYCDGVVVHPYGGDAGQNGGAAGDRHLVQQAHEQSNKPVWITEVGWPTAIGQPPTGDSQQWTLEQQAANYKSFCQYAVETPWIAAVFFYGYKNAADTGSAQYGVEMHDTWTHKLSFAVLGEACKKLAAGESLGWSPTRATLVSDGYEPPKWKPHEKPTPHQAALGSSL
jgi:hypothetical protein